MRYFFAILTSLIAGETQAESITIPDCSLIFVEHGNAVVQSWTKSTVTHVAVVVYEGGKPYVYEAEPPVVKRYPLVDWFLLYAKNNQGSHKKQTVTIFVSKEKYTKEQTEAYKNYLEKQAGRRYSLRGFVRGIPGDGIHCAEMTAEMLGYKHPYTYSPATLLKAIRPTHHQLGESFYVEFKDAKRKSALERSWNWCESGGKWCFWSCKETWWWCQ